MRNCLFLLRPVALAIVALCAHSSLCSASIEILATDSGWYNDEGRHNSNASNSIVQINVTGNQRNFFVFDLSGVTNTILSASLRLEHPVDTINGAASTYTVYDVSTDVATLTTSQTTATSIYADLGSGAVYGSVAVATTISPGIIEVPLNATAITAMNSTEGLFAIGGALSVAGSQSAKLFEYTTGSHFIRKLVLDLEEPTTNPGDALVPEPLSLAVWGGIAVVGSLGAFVRQRRSAA